MGDYDMKSSAGRRVSGDDFFNREKELSILETYVRDHNHVPLRNRPLDDKPGKGSE